MSDNRNYGQLFYNFYKSFLNNEIPQSATQELKYFIKCRNDRLKRLGIELKYNLKSDEDDQIHSSYYTISDMLSKSKYNTMKYWCILGYAKEYISNGRRIYKRNERVYFYETIYDVFDKQNYADLLYNCPNCGAPSKIEELEVNGCKYCGTKFIMNDLFPKVSNYYTMVSVGDSLKDRKKFFNTCGLISGIALTMWYIISKQPDFSNPFVGIMICICVFGLTYFLGIIVASFLSLNNMIFKTIKIAQNNSDIIPERKSSIEKMNNELKKINEKIKYEYFESKVLSLVRTILMNDNRDLLPQNGTANLDKEFDNLVDMSYRQLMKLKEIKKEGNYIVVDIYVYLNNDYFINGKIVNTNDCLLVTMVHDSNYDIDENFILSAVNCKGCGASFDATHAKKCPFCNSEYHNDQEDWVVTNIQKEK